MINSTCDRFFNECLPYTAALYSSIISSVALERKIVVTEVLENACQSLPLVAHLPYRVAKTLSSTYLLSHKQWLYYQLELAKSKAV